MTAVFATKALLPGGWADDVLLRVSGGRIASVEVGARPDGAETCDCVIPGLGNSHSHAFQRALAGRTEERSPAEHDNFWTWRERMYELAEAVDANRLTPIARQVYVEMVTMGYTSVAEFHYLHRGTDDGMFDDAMFTALSRAARDSGIRHDRMFPYIYERSGFDDPVFRAGSASDCLPSDVAGGIPGSFRKGARNISPDAGDFDRRIGAHSLRAVTPDFVTR